MSKRISKAVANGRTLTITVDGNERPFSWLWLRDHSQEPESFHKKARQRLIETFHLGTVPPATNIAISENGNCVSILWDSGQTSQFTADYLATIGIPIETYDVIGSDHVLWNADSVQSLVKGARYADFVSDDSVLAEMLDRVRRYGMVLLREAPTEIATARRVMERISYIRSSIFGDMWELKSDGKIADTGSTSLEIRPHTDGTYSHDAPGLMMLQCLAYDAVGGENILVDGFAIAEQIRKNSPDIYEILSTVAVPGQYIGDGAYLVAQRPPFRHDAAGKLVQVSFNNHDRAPFWLPEPDMSRLYEALGVFDNLAQDRANQFIFGQRPGDLVIFDNWRLLHGRLSFKGKRHMVGCYLNREDFESRIRMLAADRPLDMVAS